MLSLRNIRNARRGMAAGVMVDGNLGKMVGTPA